MRSSVLSEVYLVIGVRCDSPVGMIKCGSSVWHFENCVKACLVVDGVCMWVCMLFVTYIMYLAVFSQPNKNCKLG